MKWHNAQRYDPPTSCFSQTIPFLLFIDQRNTFALVCSIANRFLQVCPADILDAHVHVVYSSSIIIITEWESKAKGNSSEVVAKRIRLHSQTQHNAIQSITYCSNFQKRLIAIFSMAPEQTILGQRGRESGTMVERFCWTE